MIGSKYTTERLLVIRFHEDRLMIPLTKLDSTRSKGTNGHIKMFHVSRRRKCSHECHLIYFIRRRPVGLEEQGRQQEMRRQVNGSGKTAWKGGSIVPLDFRETLGVRLETIIQSSS